VVQGFFTREETRSKTRPDGRVYSCAACGLYKNVLSPRMKPFGEFGKKILNIGEAPGETEDRRGRQWQGKIGQALQNAYEELGYNLFEDSVNINSINCRPTDRKGDNRSPDSSEIAACRKRVFHVIEEYKPNLILLHGGQALESILGHRWDKGKELKISKWRGFTIPDRDLGAWVCPVFHPGYPERADQEVRTIWMRDLKQALRLWKVPFPSFQDERKMIRIVEGDDQIREVLLRFKESPLFAFDFETTGRKPHRKHLHRIVCISLCDSKNEAVVFMLPKDPELLRLLRKVLQSKGGKIGQHIKHEECWAYNILGYPVRNWVWDTMLASRTLVARPGCAGLKFQVYVNWGILGYGYSVAPYLKTTDKDANAVNRIEELVSTRAGMLKLLLYCGMDSLFTYQLGLLQIERVSPDLLPQGVAA
jgi:uracil-DNA glycosylase family 4